MLCYAIVLLYPAHKRSVSPAKGTAVSLLRIREISSESLDKLLIGRWSLGPRGVHYDFDMFSFEPWNLKYGNGRGAAGARVIRWIGERARGRQRRAGMFIVVACGKALT